MRLDSFAAPLCHRLCDCSHVCSSPTLHFLSSKWPWPLRVVMTRTLFFFLNPTKSSINPQGGFLKSDPNYLCSYPMQIKSNREFLQKPLVWEPQSLETQIPPTLTFSQRVELWNGMESIYQKRICFLIKFPRAAAWLRRNLNATSLRGPSSGFGPTLGSRLVS